jgi:hypothetical protein
VSWGCEVGWVVHLARSFSGRAILNTDTWFWVRCWALCIGFKKLDEISPMRMK